MKVILSAFSCEPGLGSEEAVGWGWVTGLAARCEKVLVVTRIHNRERIENWLQSHSLDNVEFLYYKPRGHDAYRHFGRFKWVPYYVAWQRGIIEPIRLAMANEDYELVHHVTVVSMRFAVRLGELGIPFVYGPIAGGDSAPRTAWQGMTWRGKMGEAFRTASNQWLKWSPAIRRTLESATAIIAVSPETAALVPPHLLNRVSQVLAISYDEPLRRRTIPRRPSSALNLLFAARCLDWKGLHIGLPAIARAIDAGVELHLTVVGDGPVRGHWQQLAERLGIAGRIAWVESAPRAEFIRSLPTYDLLFFPSLHDSGALVVLEALANGVPVVCLDAGGPGQLVDASCGIKVRIEHHEQMVADLAAALVRLARDETLRHSMAVSSIERISDHFTLDKKIDAVMAHYPVRVRQVKRSVAAVS
jgi:glycosyltransferase involved in cell wall biosynthesis